MADSPPTLLIVEDGDEYRANFSRLFGETATLKQVRTGAAARAVLKQDPDVDLLVEFQPGCKSFDSFMGLAYFLEALLDRRVELITPESLSPNIGPHILAHVEYVSIAA